MISSTLLRREMGGAVILFEKSGIFEVNLSVP